MGSGCKLQIKKPSNASSLHWCSNHICALKLVRLEVKKRRKKNYFQIVSFILNISQPLGRHGAPLHSSGQPNIVQKLEEFCQGSCSRDGRVGTASQDCPDLRTVFLLTWGPKGGRRLDEGAFPGRGHILQMGYGWKNGVSKSMEGIFATSLMADLKPQWCLSIPRPQL